VSEHPDLRPTDDTDAVRDIARNLAEVAARISTFKGEANAYLSDPTYNALRLRLENAHAEVASVGAGGMSADARARRVEHRST
jgi:hypothetical protein